MSYETYEVRVYDNGTENWHLNDQLHRENGPAIEGANGNKAWFLNGLLHRKNGPAVEWIDGSKFWYKDGQLHRKNGPAKEYADGDKHWYLNGQRYTEKEYWAKVNKPDCNAREVEIDGQKYKLSRV